ncbi:MAG: methionyl-tRNA formyltransferase [Faecalibacterium sp.]|nr:methionyl-tRNA formyltransferase [Ruminococcus sp.]MCM1392229.1 methionyl-tRNA formyltransferase [Ruminococcus sp.]MCM1484932.1 methionyl-tRNA formyltransferase [Faecalibacterium sp.]
MKIAFMGTPDFAVDCLKALAESEHEIVGVFCQPDKPVGRKQELKMPDVKVEALKHDLKIFQPTSLRNGKGVEILKEIDPELVVVVAYGKLLPDDFLKYPKYGCINIHASILPKYRGASPIHWAVINGDSETGVTAMQMDEGLDTGDILLVSKMAIGENDTTEDMYEKLAPLGAKTLMETISLIEKDELKPIKQNDAEASNVGLLTKEMSVIDWNDTAEKIHNKIRGLYSWPGTSTKLAGKILKIHSAVLSDIKGNNIPGAIVDCSGKLVICCGDNNCIELKTVQLEGKKRMDTSTFLNGVRIEKGTVLGNI